jgi:hypothetical protein
VISFKKFDGYNGFKYKDGFLTSSNANLLRERILTCAWSPIVWKGGIRRSENFEQAHFLVLDFDTLGDETMDGVNDSLKDHKRIIATTRSHGILKNGIICDRYRLIIPFTTPINNIEVYKYNYSLALKRFWWADSSCKCGARFFFPSKEIVFFDREAEYTWDVVDLPCASTVSVDRAFTRPEINGRIPSWCRAFINDGVLDKNHSRNTTLFKVACEMSRQGFTESKIRQVVLRAPINWDGVSVESAIKSAIKTVKGN